MLALARPYRLSVLRCERYCQCPTTHGPPERSGEAWAQHRHQKLPPVVRVTPQARSLRSQLVQVRRRTYLYVLDSGRKAARLAHRNPRVRSRICECVIC